MKILLAGPGTGKTTKIKSLIDDFARVDQCLILSFTNATVNDLLGELSSKGVTENNCMTLHKFAVKYNHDLTRHVLQFNEEDILKKIAPSIELDFPALCDHLGATTFNQMIDRFVAFAKGNKLYLEEKLNGYEYLIVDEYQDFNPHEQALLELLFGYFKEVIILGDDDQCIYDFKDASSEKIIEFQNSSVFEKVDHEHICYRCPDSVVEHATNLILNNKKRVSKDWKKSGRSGNILHTQMRDLDSAAEYVVQDIKKMQKSDPSASILILAPMGFIVDPVIEKLNNEGLDYENANAIKVDPLLIEKSWEIKSLFGKFKYLNLLLLGYRSLSVRKPLYAILKNHLQSGLKYEELFEKLTKKIPKEVIGQYNNLEEMLSIEGYQKLKSLYDEAVGLNEDEKLESIFKVNNEEAVHKKIRVMSIHKSKGLGADHVFIIGLTEGILPSKKAGLDSIESQRRLFYVGITRAKKSLNIISILKIPGKFANRVNREDFAYDYKSKLCNGKASMFIEELKLT